MAELHLALGDEMVERATRSLHDDMCTCGDPNCGVVARGAARRALTAAFEGVPITNYGIGLCLQFFDLVICVKNDELQSAAGVYAKNGEPDGFDDVSSHLDIGWSDRPTRHISRVAVSGLRAPGGDRA